MLSIQTKKLNLYNIIKKRFYSFKTKEKIDSEKCLLVKQYSAKMYCALKHEWFYLFKFVFFELCTAI